MTSTTDPEFIASDFFAEIPDETLRQAVRLVAEALDETINPKTQARHLRKIRRTALWLRVRTWGRAMIGRR